MANVNERVVTATETEVEAEVQSRLRAQIESNEVDSEIQRRVNPLIQGAAAEIEERIQVEAQRRVQEQQLGAIDEDD